MHLQKISNFHFLQILKRMPNALGGYNWENTFIRGEERGGVGHHIYISLRMGKNPQFNGFILESLFISSMRCLTGA